MTGDRDGSVVLCPRSFGCCLSMTLPYHDVDLAARGRLPKLWMTRKGSATAYQVHCGGVLAVRRARPVQVIIGAAA